MERLRPAEQDDADMLAQLKATNPALEHYTGRTDLEVQFFIGTPCEVTRRVQEYVDLGVTLFMLWFMDFPSRAGTCRFAEEIILNFR